MKEQIIRWHLDGYTVTEDDQKDGAAHMSVEHTTTTGGKSLNKFMVSLKEASEIAKQLNHTNYGKKIEECELLFRK